MRDAREWICMHSCTQGLEALDSLKSNRSSLLQSHALPNQ